MTAHASLTAPHTTSPSPICPRHTRVASSTPLTTPARLPLAQTIMELPTPIELKNATRDRIGFVLNQGLISPHALDLTSDPNKTVMIEAAAAGFPALVNRVAHVGQQDPDRFLATHTAGIRNGHHLRTVEAPRAD